jgi:hypothetical protein
MTCIPTCLTHGRQCEDIAKVEAQAAEIERLIKASDGDVGLMHWQGEKIERLEAEIEYLRNQVDSMIGSMADITALAMPAQFIIDRGETK